MLYNPYCLAIVLVTPNGIVNPTTPISYMTHASTPVPVVSCLSSPLIHLYCLSLSSPYTLGQQVNVYCLTIVLYHLVYLFFSIASLYTIVQTAYCLVLSIVLPPSIMITYACY